MTTHPAEIDPRVRAANIRAAARNLAEAAARVEMVSKDLKDLDHTRGPPRRTAGLDRVPRHCGRRTLHRVH